MRIWLARPLPLLAAALLLVSGMRMEAAGGASFLAVGLVHSVASTFNSILGTYSAKDYGAVGNGTADDTAAIQSCIAAAFNAHVQTCYLPPTGNCYKTTGPLYLADPTFSSNITSPKVFGYSLALVGENGGANHEGWGSRLCPNFNNGVALWVGPGQGMVVRGLSVIGPQGGYRGNQNSNGIGVAIAGGNGGSTRALIENVEVDNFYTCFSTGTNFDALADSNSWHKVECINAYYGFNIAATENFINDIIEPTLSATIAFNSPTSKNVTIFGGNPSVNSGVSNSFAISLISSMTATVGGNCNNYYCYTFTGVIAAPDIFVGSVYNSYMLKTADFGIIPLIMTNWNSATNTGTFRIWPNWGFYYFQNGTNAVSLTNLQSEIQAVTTIYAAERVTVLNGISFDWTGGHVENSEACQTFVHAAASSNGDSGISVRRVFFNAEISLNQYKPANNPTPAQLALFYCQQSFPFIFADSGASGTINLENDMFIQLPDGSSDPVVIDWQGAGQMRLVVTNTGRSGESLFNPSIRVTQQIYNPISGGYNYIYTPAFGAGEWNQTPFLPTNSSARGGQLGGWATGLGIVPYVGWRPALWAHPRITPSIYTTLTGSLPALGTYPIIDGSTIYSVLDWNTGAVSHLFTRSAGSG